MLTEPKRNSFATLIIRGEGDQVLVCMHSFTGHLVLPAVTIRHKSLKAPGIVKSAFFNKHEFELEGDVESLGVLNYTRITKDHVSNVEEGFFEISSDNVSLPKPKPKGTYRWAVMMSIENLFEIMMDPVENKRLSSSLVKALSSGLIN